MENLFLYGTLFILILSFNKIKLKALGKFGFIWSS